MGTDTNLSLSEVESLAPDVFSLQEARGLVTQSKWKWPELKYSKHALWGKYQGCGENPFVAMVDLSQDDIAFKCSCPSPRFVNISNLKRYPCKHGLALLLMFVQHKDWFSADSEPPEVNQWLEKRAATEQKKEQQEKTKAAGTDDTSPSPAKSATILKREADIAEDIAKLKLWLRDSVRKGLRKAILPIDMPYRCIDLNRLNAMGIVNLVDLALLNDCTDNESLNTYLRQLSRLYLVVSAFEHRESLSPELQSEIASIVGINPSREEVLTANFIAHGGEDINPEKLVVLADLPYPTYHYGEIHRQFCYSFERQAFVTNDVFVSSDVEDAAALTERPLPIGTIFTAKAYNYLGVSVVPRVLLEEKHFLQAAELDNISGSGCAATTPLPALKSVRNLQEACDAKSRYFEQNPFADFYPVVVEHVRFAQQGSKLSGTWFLCDQDGKARALSGHKEKLHKHVVSCLALTFGHDFTAVVLLNDNQMLLCGISYQGQYLSLPLGELQLFFNRAS